MIPLIELSFDDGTIYDALITDLLSKHKLKAVFYLPIKSFAIERNIELYKDQEVGCHTYTHPMDLKTVKDLNLEIDFALKKLREIFPQKQINKFCPPRGRYDDRVITHLKKVGFQEMRTTIVLKVSDEDEFIKHTALHFYNRNEYCGEDWLEVGKKLLDNPNAQVLRFWGHSKEIVENNDLEKLDKFFQLINERLNR